MTKVIFLNAPPRSGKDAVQSIFAKYANVVHFKIAKPLKDGTFSLLGLGNIDHFEMESLKDSEIDFSVSIEFFENNNASVLEKALLERKAKEHGESLITLSELFFLLGAAKTTNITYREMLIHVSEDVLKPLFGQDVFGKAAVKYLKSRTEDLTDPVVISDCGFVDEMFPIINFFGKENCHVIKVKRPGYNFGGDSRSYVDIEKLGLDEHWIINDGSLEELETKAKELFENIVWN